MIEDGYAYRPGLVSLIATGLSAEKNAEKAGLNADSLKEAIDAAKATAEKPVEERSYALAIRKLRQAIRALHVPEANLPVLNPFKTNKW